MSILKTMMVIFFWLEFIFVSSVLWLMIPGESIMGRIMMVYFVSSITLFAIWTYLKNDEWESKK